MKKPNKCTTDNSGELRSPPCLTSIDGQNTMLLKPRIATRVAMIIGGSLLSFGLLFGFQLGGFLGLIQSAFGVLGVLWVILGVFALTQRERMRIRIDDSGIEIPAGSEPGRALLRKEEIETITKHESLKGRQIQVLMKSGQQLLLPVREYCELKDFIAYCREHGLPV